MAFTWFWVISFVAAAWAATESVWSSSLKISIGWPSTPPALLISSTARFAPFVSPGPNRASPPVNDKSVPIRRCAFVGANSPPRTAAARTTTTTTMTAPEFCEGGGLDGPTSGQGRTRCTNRGGTPRTRSATWAPRPGTGGWHPEKRRARWSLLRGPLRPDEAGIIYTMSRRRRSILSRGRSPPPEGGVDGLENVFTARVRSHRSNRGGG